jgi:DNA-binding LacI/PurR family transcriptional regulator
LKSISEIEFRGPDEGRRVSAADVARWAGVSKATVSRVLNGEQRYIRPATRERVLEGIRVLNYRPNLVASSMRTGRTYMIALIIPDITNPFWPEVARGVQDRAAKAGYHVVVANADWHAEREAEFLAFAADSRMDGLIVNPSGPVETVLAAGMPVVLLGSRTDDEPCDVVTSDTYGGVRLATRHLLRWGHRRIGFIRGRGGGAGARQRGYADELAEWDLAVDDRFISEVPYTLLGGQIGARELLTITDPPTALLGANDLLAVGAMFAARDLGLAVPDDLSVIGVDDTPMAAATWPGLTTVVKPKYDIGRTAFEVLLKRFADDGNGPLPQRVVLPVSLVERGSVAAPRRNWTW